MPVNFVDAGGGVQATLTFVQRPAKITFSTDTIKFSYLRESTYAIVTIENNAVWGISSIQDPNGADVSSWLTVQTSSSSAVSGSDIYMMVSDADNSSPRMAYIRVEGLATKSKPLFIKQEGKPAFNRDPGDAFEINNVMWTNYNLYNPRQSVSAGVSFATKLPSECTGIRAESHGKFYRWGVNVGWSTVGMLSSMEKEMWSASYPVDNWYISPCPEGYRIPKLKEFEALIANCSIELNGGWGYSDYGYITMSPKDNPSKKLEFPAVGRRDVNGSLSWSGVSGAYLTIDKRTDWSADAMSFSRDDGGAVTYRGVLFTDAANLRCVKDVNVLWKTIKMGNLEWTEFNLSNPKQSAGGATLATDAIGSSERFGRFYQWGINVSWNTTENFACDPIPYTDDWSFYNESPDWVEHPCPDGFRLPTKAEFEDLINNSTVSGYYGIMSYTFTFTSKTDASERLTFCGSGQYRTNEGRLSKDGSRFWCSDESDTKYAYYMYLYLDPDDQLYCDIENGKKTYGCYVRCVRDK